MLSALLVIGTFFTAGALWLGPRAVEAQFEPDALVFSENFDAVAAGTLPAGWASTNSGMSQPWITVATIPDSAPNAVYANDPEFTGSSSLTTPAITLGNLRHKLTFRQRYQMDYEFDGGVLEVSINGGAFNDVISAGGTFVSGGYDTQLVGGTLSGRQGWTGDSVFYITTEINLPASTNNQSIRLRWRFGSDDMEGGDGWRIDNVQITNAISGFNSNAIPIPDSGASSNYPSQIPVTDQTGLVSGVQVTLQNFSHTAPDDVDVVLVSPSGSSVVLMSDVGGANPVSNLNLVFDDTSTVSLPDSGAIASGTYKPTDFEPGDAFPAPGPPGTPTGRTLSTFNGTNGNGNWRLFLVDDAGNNAGNISGGWYVAVQSSPDVIGLQTTGAGTIYPSQRLVAGLLGTVTNVTVNVTNLSHTAVNDMDLLLVAPNGRKVVLMSDVGGPNEVAGLTLTFDDAAATNLPQFVTPTSGTFRPTDVDPGDVFPAPAPSGAPTGTALSAFYGSAPNGQWRLYAVDDTGNANGGSIAGNWSVNVTTSTTACDFTIAPNAQSFPITGGTGGFGITMPPACSWTATSNSGFITLNSAAAGNGDGAVSFSVAANQGGPRSGFITVSNGYATRVFTVQQPSGCPSSLSQSTVSFTSAGGSGSVAVTAGTPCTYNAQSGASWVQITSPTQTGNGNITFNVSANTGGPRSTTVFVSGISFNVSQGGTSRRFDFDADGRSDLSVYRPGSPSSWWILNSGTPGSYSASPFGVATDRPVPADFDGDRRADIAVYRDGTWYAYLSQSNTVRIVQWGVASDVPMPGDIDGDGKADMVVYRGSETRWYIFRSSDGAFQFATFGVANGKPLSGDFDGDGRMDLAYTIAGDVVRAWGFSYTSGAPDAFPTYGLANDIAVPADFDGDGDDNMAVFRPSEGTWYTSTNPATNYGAIRFGAAGDVPVAADYDGDGKADAAVFRNGIWYILNSSSQSVRIDTWGASGDTGLPGVYNAQ